MPYGISVPNSDGPEAVGAFLRVGGEQVANLPDEIEDLVVPFGSGNTLAGILYEGGLSTSWRRTSPICPGARSPRTNGP